MAVLIATVTGFTTKQIWDQGIAVGVITICAILIWRLISIGVDKFETASNFNAEKFEKITGSHSDQIEGITDRHAKTIEGITGVHRDERREWLQMQRDERDQRETTAEKRDKQIQDVCGQLLTAINNSKND